jgi:hypothetical protein
MSARKIENTTARAAAKHRLRKRKSRQYSGGMSNGFTDAFALDLRDGFGSCVANQAFRMKQEYARVWPARQGQRRGGITRDAPSGATGGRHIWRLWVAVRESGGDAR